MPEASQAQADGRLVLSPATAITVGQAVVVTYTDPTTGDDSDVVEDLVSNEAATFTTGEDGVVAVTNNVGTEVPEGEPSIGGRIAVGETLTADTSTITDDDGRLRRDLAPSSGRGLIPKEPQRTSPPPPDPRTKSSPPTRATVYG